MKIESEPGQGTFRVKLPTAEASSLTKDEKEGRKHLTLVSTSSLPKILVVDDEQCIRELLTDILEGEGYEVTLAQNGEEALKFFDASNYTAVFTDVGMPGMSGWELARAIRERDEEIPMAVITGWGESVSSTEQQTAKVDWVVTKPFSIDRISELAAEIIHRSEAKYASRVRVTGT